MTYVEMLIFRTLDVIDINAQICARLNKAEDDGASQTASRVTISTFGGVAVFIRESRLCTIPQEAQLINF